MKNPIRQLSTLRQRQYSSSSSQRPAQKPVNFSLKQQQFTAGDDAHKLALRSWVIRSSSLRIGKGDTKALLWSPSWKKMINSSLFRQIPRIPNILQKSRCK